jgi:hypothetical protein
MPGLRPPGDHRPNYQAMDELIQQVLERVRELAKLGRDAGYEKFVELVEFRQVLTDLIAEKDNLTIYEKRMINEILSYDQQILGAMKFLKDEAEEGLGRIRSSRKQKTIYNQPDSYNSIMLDTKK